MRPVDSLAPCQKHKPVLSQISSLFPTKRLKIAASAIRAFPDIATAGQVACGERAVIKVELWEAVATVKTGETTRTTNISKLLSRPINCVALANNKSI